MKGIIFDFNGTMFLDSPLHEQAWLHMITKYSKATLEPTEIVKQIHGQTNAAILKHFISPELTDTQIAKLAGEKESYYRQLVKADPNQIQLTAGLAEVLDTLVIEQIPLTIASVAPQANMNFYFEVFDLARWFDQRNVVVDDGTFPGKPAPDIFLKAAAKLNLDPTDCIVIEDSYSGLQAARNAAIGSIVAIDPAGHNTPLFEAENLAPNGIIKDFTHFEQNILDPLFVH